MTGLRKIESALPTKEVVRRFQPKEAWRLASFEPDEEAEVDVDSGAVPDVE